MSSYLYPGTFARCKRCNVRRMQGHCKGHCLTCARELGIRTRRPRKKKKQGLWESPKGGKPVPVEELLPRPSSVRVVGGVEYEVVWDGS